MITCQNFELLTFFASQHSMDNVHSLASSLTTAAESLITASLNHTQNQMESHMKDSVEVFSKIEKTTTELLNAVPVFVDILEEQKRQSTQSMQGVNDKLMTEFTQIKSVFKLQHRTLSLQFAMSNSQIGSFTYYQEGTKESLNSSSDVIAVCMAWMRSESYPLAKKSLLSYPQLPNIRVKGEQDYRNALCHQIHGLTGIRGYIENDTLIIPEL